MDVPGRGRACGTGPAAPRLERHPDRPAQGGRRADVTITIGGSNGLVPALQIILFLTALALVPAVLVMMTAFTRILVVLSFVRTAVGAGQVPPNAVIIGLALFLTIFVMAPVGQAIYQQAWVPFRAGQIDQATALRRAEGPARDFMLKQTRESDLALFWRLSGHTGQVRREDVPLTALVPAFAISELKTAFEMGFIIYIPFLVIDMVVASTLMSMGMLMLPPVLVSLPFKVLLFVLVDGWHLVAQNLVQGY
ncbi:MAG: flagellar type III secretion system pore protein FliP [Clostridia bacterium]|nr:flagellar type III secretion system pore protein FliP [Clostridia bacterium]